VQWADPELEKEYKGHAEHDVMPLLAVYLPEEHDKHIDDDEYEPATHNCPRKDVEPEMQP